MHPSHDGQSEISVTRRECSYCKELLRVADFGTHKMYVEVASGTQHVCWLNLPQDANLLVLGDE